MIGNVTNEITTAINKIQDEWFKEVINKHLGIVINTDDVDGFDVYFLITQYHISIKRDNDVIKVFIKDELVGTFEFIKEDTECTLYNSYRSTLSYKVNQWIK